MSSNRFQVDIKNSKGKGLLGIVHCKDIRENGSFAQIEVMVYDPDGGTSHVYIDVTGDLVPEGRAFVPVVKLKEHVR